MWERVPSRDSAPAGRLRTLNRTLNRNPPRQPPLPLLLLIVIRICVICVICGYSGSGEGRVIRRLRRFSPNVGAADAPKALCEPIGESEASTIPRFPAPSGAFVIVIVIIIVIVPALQYSVFSVCPPKPRRRRVQFLILSTEYRIPNTEHSFPPSVFRP